MYNHVGIPWTRRYLERHTEIRVLHLRRENLLKQYVSYLLMGRPRVTRWQPHVTAPIPPIASTCHPRRRSQYMRRTTALYPRFEELFRRIGACRSSTSTRSTARVCARMSRTLSATFSILSRRPMGSRLVKINPDDLRDMVTNYDEVAGDGRRPHRVAHLLPRERLVRGGAA